MFACWRTRTAISVLARQRSGPNFASSSRFAKRVRKLRLLRVTISRYISLGQTLRRAFIQPTQSLCPVAGSLDFGCRVVRGDVTGLAAWPDMPHSSPTQAWNISFAPATPLTFRRIPKASGPFTKNCARPTSCGAEPGSSTSRSERNARRGDQNCVQIRRAQFCRGCQRDIGDKVVIVIDGEALVHGPGFLARYGDAQGVFPGCDIRKFEAAIGAGDH